MNPERMPVPETLDLTAPHRRGRRHLCRRRQLWSLRPGKPPAPLELVSLKCQSLARTGRYEDASALLATHLPKAEALGDRAWAASLSGDLAHALRVLGNAGTALPHAERARGLYAELGDEAGLAGAMHNLAVVYSDLDQGGRYLELSRGTLELAERNGLDSLTVQTLFDLREELGLEEALGRIGAYLEKARAAGDLALMGKAAFLMGDIYLNTGRWAEAEACNVEMYRAAGVTGNRMAMSFAIGDRGLIYSGQGRYREAIECYLEKLEISEVMGDYYNVFEAQENMGTAHLFLGETGKALEWYKRAEDNVRRHQVQHFLSKVLVLRAQCLLELGDRRRAAEAASEALEIARDIGYRFGLFYGALVEARLAAAEDGGRGISMLEALLSEAGGDEEAAEVHYELFRLTGDAGHRTRALDRYRRYYGQTRMEHTKRRIAELESG
jgi:tetratricopeptide (TPR) repeat protein